MDGDRHRHRDRAGRRAEEHPGRSRPGRRPRRVDGRVQGPGRSVSPAPRKVAVFPLIGFVWFVGALDSAFVVATAARLGMADPNSMGPLRTLPLSLLPTFLVPLIIASHALIFWRLVEASDRRA